MLVYETTASDVALSFDKVVASRYYRGENVVIVAVLTTPLYTASERNSLREEIRAKIENDFAVKTIVTYDLGAYMMMHDGMSEKEISSLYRKVGYSPL